MGGREAAIATQAELSSRNLHLHGEGSLHRMGNHGGQHTHVAEQN